MGNRIRAGAQATVAAALALSLTPAQAIAFAAGTEGTDAVTGAASLDADGSAESNASADAAQETSQEGQGELKENSWRYQDGVLIVDGSEYASGEASARSGFAWSWTENGYVNPDGNVIAGALNKGVDVSEHQGWIDWEAVKADGIDFAIIRCGYGSDYESQDDDYWEYNVSECERLGIPYGVYLYSYAYNTSMAASEAQHALRLLEGRHPTLPVFYDMEDSSTLSYYADGSVNTALLGDMAEIFCEAMENAGYWAGVYANLNWFNNYLTDPRFENYMRWVAQYNNHVTGTDYAGYHVLWQCTSSGQVNGIQGNVDINFDYFGFGFPADVKEHYWYVRDGSFTYVTKQGLMSGYPNGYWGPDDTLTRGMVATILWRAEGQPWADAANFSDVDYAAYYGSAIEWARSTGVINGYGDTNTFGADDPVTREQFAQMLANYAAYRGLSTASTGAGLSARPDASSVSGWAWSAMAWAFDRGIISGQVDDAGVQWLNPQSTATRAEAARMLTVFLRDVL